MNFISPMIASSMAEIVRQKEASIRAALDDLIPGWSLLEIPRRCTFIRHHDSPNELLCLDGKPIMEFFPLESSMDEEGDKYVIRVTQKYRRLA